MNIREKKSLADLTLLSIQLCTSSVDLQKASIMENDLAPFVSFCEEKGLINHIISCFSKKFNGTKSPYFRELLVLVNECQKKGYLAVAEALLDACFNQILDEKLNLTLIEELVTEDEEILLKLIKKCIELKNGYKILLNYSKGREGANNLFDRLLVLNKFTRAKEVLSCLLNDEYTVESDMKDEEIALIVAGINRKFIEHLSVNKSNMRKIAESKSASDEKNEFIKLLDSLDFLYPISKIQSIAAEPDKFLQQKNIYDEIKKIIYSMDKAIFYEVFINILKISNENLSNLFLKIYVETLVKIRSEAARLVLPLVFKTLIDERIHLLNMLITAEILEFLIKNNHNDVLEMLFKCNILIKMLENISIDMLYIEACSSNNISFLKLINEKLKQSDPFFLEKGLKVALDNYKSDMVRFLFENFHVLPKLDINSTYLNAFMVTIFSSSNPDLIGKFLDKTEEEPGFLKNNLKTLISMAMFTEKPIALQVLLSRKGIFNYFVDKKEEISALIKLIMPAYYMEKDFINLMIVFIDAISIIDSKKLKKEFCEAITAYVMLDRSVLDVALGYDHPQILNFYFLIQKEFPELNVFATLNSEKNNILHVLIKNEKFKVFESFITKMRNEKFIDQEASMEILYMLFSQENINNKTVLQLYNPDHAWEFLGDLNEEYNINRVFVNFCKNFDDDFDLIHSMLSSPYFNCNLVEAIYYALKNNHVNLVDFLTNDANWDIFIASIKISSMYSNLLLSLAYEKGKKEIVNALIKNSKNCNNMFHGMGKNIFDLAIDNKDWETIQKLIENDFDIFRGGCNSLFIFTRFNELNGHNNIHLNDFNEAVINGLNKVLDNNQNPATLISSWASKIMGLYKSSPPYQEGEIYALVDLFLSRLKCDPISFLKEVYFPGQKITKSNILSIACNEVAADKTSTGAIFAVIKAWELNPNLIPTIHFKNKKDNYLCGLLKNKKIDIAKQIIFAIEKSRFSVDDKENNTKILELLNAFSSHKISTEFSEFMKKEIARLNGSAKIVEEFNLRLQDPDLITADYLNADLEGQFLNYVITKDNLPAFNKIRKMPNSNQFFLRRDKNNQTILSYVNSVKNIKLDLIEKYKAIFADELKNKKGNYHFILAEFNKYTIPLNQKELLKFIFIACAAGNLEAMDSLFDYADKNRIEINIDALNTDGLTLLGLACSYGYGQVVKFLLSKNALCHPNTLKDDSLNALHIAIREEHEDIVKDLLLHDNMDEAVIRRFMFSALKKGDMGLVQNKAIREQYPDILFTTDDTGNSLFHVACAYAHPDFGYLLGELQKIPDSKQIQILNKLNQDRITLLDLACESQDEKIVQLLLQTNKIDIFRSSVLKNINKYPLEILVLLQKMVVAKSELTLIQKDQVNNINTRIAELQEQEKVNQDRKQHKQEKKSKKEKKGDSEQKVLQDSIKFFSPKEKHHQDGLNGYISATDLVYAQASNNIGCFSAFSDEMKKVLSTLSEEESKKFEYARGKMARKKGNNGIKLLSGLKFKTINLTDEEGNSILDSEGKEVTFRTCDFFELKIGNNESRFWGIKINSKNQDPLIYFIGYLPNGLHTQGDIDKFNAIKSLQVIMPGIEKNDLKKSNQKK